MSKRSIIITGEGIDKLPLFEKDGEDYVLIKNQFGFTFSPWSLTVKENEISMDVSIYEEETSNFLDVIVAHFPNRLFHYRSYCCDGCGCDYDFIKEDGEFNTYNAINDLKSIKSYIAQELCNAQSADSTVKKILKQIKILEDFPNSGTSLSTKIGVDTDYRFLICGSYSAFYRVDNDVVYVVRILYGRRDYMRILFD